MSAPRLDDVLVILDVGHGSSAVLIGCGIVVVVDAGPGSALLAFLDEQAITRIDVVLISHADQDHIGALAQLIACGRFEVGQVALNSDAKKDSTAWDDLVYELDQAHLTGTLKFDVQLVRSDHAFLRQGQLEVEVLGPSRYLAGKGPGSTDRRRRRITTNSISAAIRVAWGGVPLALLLGDLDDVGLDDLLKDPRGARAHLLLFPHHGGKPGTSNLTTYVERLLAAVQPSVVVFSIGRGVHGTPSPDVVAGVRRYKPAARILCTQLSENCADALTETPGDHLNRSFAQGRERNRCCAGTVLMRLAQPPELLPSEADHTAFLERAAPTALCRKEAK